MQAEQTIETVRSALGRVLSPLVSWIPDVTAIPRKRQVAIAAIASILLHVLIFSGLVVHELVWATKAPPMPPPQRAALEVILRPSPVRDEEDPLFKARREIVDAKGLDASQEKPEDATAESDQNMKAGSQLPATGILPLPSQKGRTDLPGHDFRDQDVRLGVVAEQPPETLRPPDPAQKDPASVASPAVPGPLFTPQPLSPDTLAAADKSKAADPLPDPAKVAKATPPPFKMSDRPENSIAMLTATPRPRTAPPGPPAPPALAPTMPAPPKNVNDVFHQNMRKTGVEGNIVAPGPNGVNAVSSPMGRYRRRLSQQIESIWTLRRQGGNAEVGTVRVNIRLREDGTVETVRVQPEDARMSPRHTEICRQVFDTLRPEKLPPEAEPLIENGSMEFAFSFSIYEL